MSRKFRTNEDLYQFILYLAEEARQHDQEEIAQELEDSLKAGMTASDQLGGARKALISVKQAFGRTEYQDDLREDIKLAIKKLDKAFGR